MTPALEILDHQLPAVAIVGRPNVGKSTLFNRIVGRRKAVVIDTPGMTRDRNFEEAEWNGRRFAVIDTGGYESEPHNNIFEQMREQSILAIQEADIVVFLTDVTESENPEDLDVADLLRRAGKPVILAVNKCDNTRRFQEAAAFYSMGFQDLFPVSALNGGGTGELLDRVVELLPRAAADEPLSSRHGIRIAVIGRPNVGKSSLINTLLGRQRVITSEIPGTTRDTIDTTFRLRPATKKSEVPAGLPEVEAGDGLESALPTKQIPEPAGEDVEDGDMVLYSQELEDEDSLASSMEDEEDEDVSDEKAGDEGGENEEVAGGEKEGESGLSGEDGPKPALQTRAEDRIYTLIDTAGLRRRGKIERGIEQLSVFAAEASLRRCDVALILIDASQGLTEQDQHVAGYAHEEKRGCILIVNKWDLLEKDSSTAGAFAKMLRHEMGYLNYAPILMISAKTGQRVHRILDLVDKVYAECCKEIATSTLNEWLAETIQRLSPPFRKGQQLRIKYVTQVGVRPPSFRFFVNNPRLVHFSYERYLANRLRAAFGFEGVPIRLQFRRKGRKWTDEE